MKRFSTPTRARAFATHSFTVETMGCMTLNGVNLNPLSAAECSPCDTTFYQLDQQAALGNRITGWKRSSTPSRVQHYPGDPGTVSVIGMTRGTPGKRVDRGATVLNDVNAVGGQAAVSMSWHSGRWKITTMQLLD